MDYDVETVAQTGKSFFNFDKLLEITSIFISFSGKMYPYIIWLNSWILRYIFYFLF